MFVPSHYQAAVFDDVEHGTGHTVVIARAGSGIAAATIFTICSLCG